METYHDLFTRNNLPLPDKTPPEWHIPTRSTTPAQFHAFLAHVQHTYLGNPSLRITLTKCTQQQLLPRLDDLPPVLVASPLWGTLLRSMLLDINAQLFATQLKLVLIVIPHAVASVAPSVPTLLAVLLRVAIWKKRARTTRPRWGTIHADPAAAAVPQQLVNTVPSSGGGFLAARMDTQDTTTVSPSGGWTPDDPGSLMTSTLQAESLSTITPAALPSLGWRLATPALNGAASTASESWAQPPSVINPPPLSPLLGGTSNPEEKAIHGKLAALHNADQDLSRGLLMELYGTWPVNVLACARDPAAYLEVMDVGTPYAVPWAEVWRKKETLDLLSTALSGFLFNPALLVSSDAKHEIEDTAHRTSRQTTVETIAQTHSLWLGNILPRAGNTSLLGPMAAASDPKQSVSPPNRTPAAAGRDPSPTETLSSSGGSITGRYHRPPPPRHTAARRESFEERDVSTVGGAGNIIPVGPGGTYVPSQTAPIAIHGPGKTHGAAGGGGGGYGAVGGGGVGPTSGAQGDNLQVEVDGLRREKAFLEMDLRYAKVLAGSYLQHVYRLHEKVIAVITDEAERQNIYNQLKEQTSTIRSLRDELRTQRAAVERAKESIAKMQTEQREARQIQREEKKARALETSLSRAEIEDQTRILEAQKLELARVKDAHFKLDNKLREAEPKIKHIADYEKQVEKLYHNQLLWDADVRKQKETETSLSKMMSAFKQMEIVLSRYEKDKNALQAENQYVVEIRVKKGANARRRRQADRMAEMQAEISHLSEQLEAPKPFPDDIASTMRQDLEVLQTKLQEARHRIDTLEADKLELEARIEQLDYQRMTAASAQATLL
ncbi:hypothetical protein NCC49_005083 [Naganishia albida]|nr:hypothetical protein NCC49_005083 [Naganishia albida]